MTAGSWFTLLGPVCAWRGGVELDIGTPQQRGVLAVLLIRRGMQVSIEDFIGALWEQDEPRAAATAVRTYISRLRRVLAGDAENGPVIQSVAGGYRLDLPEGEVDLAVFQRHVADAERARQAGDAATRARELASGLELWRGPALAGLPGPFASRQRDHLERLRASARTAWLQAELDLGQAGQVLPEITALAAEHPLDEQVREMLILALYRAGRQADALAAYQETRSVLASELGIDPGPALQDLHGRILRADPALIPVTAGAGSGAAAAGPRAAARQPPSRRPADADAPRPSSNLPAPVSSFIGRDSELAAVAALVAGSREVTLTGPGGVGKTRLALQAAAGSLDGTREGAWFADLAPLADPELVAGTVSDVLGVSEEPGVPATDSLVAAVGSRSLLVVLDNCEHVAGACAKLAEVLLRGCPNLTLLATSREPLGIDGEQVFRVPPMRSPAEDDDIATVRASEAVRLLADRAAARGAPLADDDETAQVAGRICAMLDGLPLAIELAAARLRAMPAAELEARLGQRFALLTGGSRNAEGRQQTLRAMADWSWELLTDPEQAVLARLSVFAGGFALAAAESVAGTGAPAGQVLSLLATLVDKSLVQFGDTGSGPGRYRLLETIRQYAAEQLAALPAGEASAARTAHRDYYLALAEEAAPELQARGQAQWLDRLDAELGNLRAAIALSLAQADPGPGLRLASALGVYWRDRGHAAEGIEVLRTLLDAPAAQAPTLPRARALSVAARLLEHTGGYAIAEAYCAEALAIARDAGDDRLAGDLLQYQAWILVRQRRLDDARPLIESGLDLTRRLGDPVLAARLIAARAYAAYVDGDNTAAIRDAADAVQLSRQAGERMQTGAHLSNLGLYELADGDLAPARRHLGEALGIARTLGLHSSIAYETFSLGLAEHLSDAPDAARALFAESLDLSLRAGMRTQVAHALLGLALASRGDPAWPARLHGAADQAFADVTFAVEPLERRLALQDRQRLRAMMGDAAFDDEYAAGRTLSPADILATHNASQHNNTPT